MVVYHSQIFLFSLVPREPTNFRVEAVPPSSIQITWTAPEDRWNVLTTYTIYYNDTRTRESRREIIFPPAESHTLYNLNANTVYTLRLAASSQYGEGPPTPTLQIRTSTPSKAFMGDHYTVHILENAPIFAYRTLCQY